MTATLTATTAEAKNLPKCALSQHCYSIVRASGTTFHGMYGTWNRASMGVQSSSTNHQFVDSEMWFSPASVNAWVETGLTRGWFNVPKSNGYYAFGAYQTTKGAYHEYNLGKVTQKSSVTDEYQISRASKQNTFRIYFDGKYVTTPSVGFWSGNLLDMGGEVAANAATAGKFTMYGKGINSSGHQVNFGKQTAIVSSGLKGSKVANSVWKWWIE